MGARPRPKQTSTVSELKPLCCIQRSDLSNHRENIMFFLVYSTFSMCLSGYPLFGKMYVTKFSVHK